MNKESDYLIRNPKVIAEHLGNIYRKKCLISAHFGEHNASFLTAILGLDSKNDILKLDGAPTELLNRQLLNSGKVLFRTEIDGIKVSFSGKGIKQSQDAGQLAYELPLPSTIFWMQRRQYYRVKIPLSHVGSFCEIEFSTGQPDGSIETKTANVRLSDISICGLSLITADNQFVNDFAANQSINQCTLHLHDGGHANVGIVFKNVAKIQVGPTVSQQRIGCQLTNVSPNFESSIQQYMQNIERQMRNIGGN